MNHPIFHPGEEARIGWYAAEEYIRGRVCKIRTVIKPIAGVNRYGISTDDGIDTIVLEPTLMKRFERSDWGMLRGIWQPKREAR